MMRTVTEIVLLLLVGWVAGAETGSWCCVQPVVERLPYEYFVRIEQDMLGTFGRIMPVLMPFTVILALMFAAMSRRAPPTIKWLRMAGARPHRITTLETARRLRYCCCGPRLRVSTCNLQPEAGTVTAM